MRLIVLDTDVIVSAGINPDGDGAKLVMDWVLDGAVQVATCPAIVSEYRKVLRCTKFGGSAVSPLWLEFLVEQCMRLPDPPPWPVRELDAADKVSLALASLTGAWFVTGNLGRFPHRVRGDTIALSPAGYRRHLLRTTHSDG